MAILTENEVRSLADQEADYSVSVFLPTNPNGNSQAVDLQLKQLLDQATTMLAERGMRRSQAKRLVDPGRDMAAQVEFWEGRQQGLGMFLSEHVQTFYHLPQAAGPCVQVSRKFHITPLLKSLGDSHFFILTLSQERPRILRCNATDAVELAVPGMPPAIKRALNFAEFEEGDHPQATTSGRMRGRSKRQSAAFHGHAGERNAAKDELTQYFRLVDAALQDLLRDQVLPMVLAGVQYATAIYRSVCGYPHLIDRAIQGNVDHLNENQLHQRAWPLVHPCLDTERSKAVVKFQRLAGTGHASSDIREILPAAIAGHIETLFVDPDAQEWGCYDPQAHTTVLHDKVQPDDYELLGLAAVETLQHRGTVYAVDRTKIPGSSEVAAVYRF